MPFMPNDAQSPFPVRRYASTPDVMELPDLVDIQLESFHWFEKDGLQELFREISPIESFNKNLELSFLDHWFEEPAYDEQQCRDMDMTYSRPLWVKARLLDRETGEVQEQNVFLGEFPIMTRNGTFIISGAERVVVSQLMRSPKAYFTLEEDRSSGRKLCMAKLIPNRGTWLEFETSKRDLISVKVDRKRKLPVTVFLRAVGGVADGTDDALITMGSDEELRALLGDVDQHPDHHYLEATLEKDNTTNSDEALVELYKKLRPGDPPTLENARGYLESLLFNPRRYDLGRVGRYKLNRQLHLNRFLDHRTITTEDLVQIVRRVIQVNNGDQAPDDIDHLGNRRIKTAGELIQNQLRVGLMRMERVVRERMSIRDPEQINPISLVNIRPVVAAMREFFGGSQLSQFMNQTNPLSELTHKRTLSALGPGGLRRERAGFDVRDVHNSHYGRICPIETPEGPNIGLIGRLANFGRVNKYGFIETPYRRILRVVSTENRADLEGHILREQVVDPDSGEIIAETGTRIDAKLAERLANLPGRTQIKVKPKVTHEIVYLTADEEDIHTIAQASALLDKENHFVRPQASVRRGQQFLLENVEKIDFMDVSPKQIVGVSAALIPFLEHDDANRALMGSNMQRQAVPLVLPDAPLVGTGMEKLSAPYFGQSLMADAAGEVLSATSERIIVREDDGTDHTYSLRRFNRSNQSTCIDQHPIVNKGDRVERGQTLVDTSSTDDGNLALGQNVLVAFLSWEGGNYEDAILLSERLVRDDKFTSIHIEKHEVKAQDTKLGPEEITRDIPNVGEDMLRNLDEDGIIRIGAMVKPDDILVGKITPKGETELTPEEKLLRAIFGEKAREVKDSSLRLPHGEQGKVVDIRQFTRDTHQDLPAGVEQMVRVSIAQRRKVTAGDKMAGRHGNKGVISRVVPIEDMPFLEDGTPVDIILNPLGVPARMNIGQILETHLGWAADRLDFRAITPVFDGAKEYEIEAELARAWIVDRAWMELTDRSWQWLSEQEIPFESLSGDQMAREIYLFNILTERGESDVRERVHDLHRARRAWARVWMQEKGLDPTWILFEDRESYSREELRLADNTARQACLKLWLESRGWDTEGLSDSEIKDKAIAVSRETGFPLPTSGKQILYDGKNGEPFDRPVTVGVIYMLKLAHLVEDKVHARSTGPYSLVTQQPLGGKAQFGGQRFGEMEVWALEAYGAAHILQEMLTIKSDDVTGRTQTYEAIVKGERIQEPGIPESFRVLVKELQSLGLSVEVMGAGNERLQFGKGMEEEPLPRLGFELGLPSWKTR
ncbi:MAG: DNA-directed RNA polymerase subunit beta [Chloroflexi bacterium]|nr:DNA-directed RNA polymerase subunit beta [Chloroflexota bacterium]